MKEVVVAERVNVVLKDFHTRQLSFNQLLLLKNPVTRERDVGCSKQGVWRPQP